MKKLFISDNGSVGLDTETEELFKLTTQREGINGIFLAEEPITLVVKRFGKEYELNAKKDDIIVTFYEHEFDMPAIVIKSKEWAKNLKKYNKIMEEYRKRREEQKSDVCTNCK